MENESNAPVGATGNPVGETGNNPEASESPVGSTHEAKRGEGDWVKYDNYRKVLNEKAKLKERLADVEGKYTAETNKKLEEQNNYKALYEQEKEKREKLDTELGEHQKIFDYTVKANAVQDAVAKGGLECVDYNALFALSDVDLLQSPDGETVDGVDLFIDKARKELPYLFAKRDIPRANNLPPAFQPEQAMTTDGFLKLSKDDQQRYLDNLKAHR